VPIAQTAPKTRRKPYKLSEAQTLLLMHLSELGLQCFPEYTFHSTRKWRFDVFLPEANVGIELDGGMFSGGHRHSAAIEKDHEKSNTATMMGIRCLRFTNRQVLSGAAKEFVQEWL
jgi:very-short-patch-repair endonuclease